MISFNLHHICHCGSACPPKKASVGGKGKGTRLRCHAQFLLEEPKYGIYHDVMRPLSPSYREFEINRTKFADAYV